MHSSWSYHKRYFRPLLRLLAIQQNIYCYYVRCKCTLRPYNGYMFLDENKCIVEKGVLVLQFLTYMEMLHYKSQPILDLMGGGVNNKAFVSYVWLMFFHVMWNLTLLTPTIKS